MDCEKFDQVVLDLLYEELDDLTSTAARRHAEGCTRCRDILARLRATREVGVLPLVDPPDGLELRILAAERRARAELPVRQRLGRAISVLAGYAMRPQLAMAALLLLVIGSSLMLLRARPGEQKSMQVTERGVPESEAETVAVVPARPASPGAAADATRGRRQGRDADDGVSELPLAVASAAPEDRRSGEAAADSADKLAEGEADDAAAAEYAEALAAYRDRRYDEARRRFGALAARGDTHAPASALYEAQSARASEGCSGAAQLFADVFQRYPDTSQGQEAAWQAAGCYRTLGDVERARRHYEALAHTAGYIDRAQAALASLGDAEPVQMAARARKGETQSSEEAAVDKAANAAPRPVAGAPAATRPAEPEAKEPAKAAKAKVAPAKPSVSH